MKKKVFFTITAVIICLFMTSCSDDVKGKVDSEEFELTSETATFIKIESEDVLDSDDTWQNNYALSYSFYDKNTGLSEITEGRCGKYYQAVDKTSGITTFISQEDGYMLEYILDPKTKTGTSTINTESTIDELYSGFVQLSTCDPYFPAYKNVTKYDNEFIANRSATRYKQVETENNKETKIAYIWIDDALGFASKCELYDVQTQELLMKWELLSFTLDATEDAVKINTDLYDLS